MSADPVTAVGNALAGFFTTLKPVIDNHYAQKFDNEHKDRINESDEILSIHDNDTRAYALASYVTRLCISAGLPAGDLQGTSIEIPLSHFRTLILIASEKIRDDQYLARMEFKTQ